MRRCRSIMLAALTLLILPPFSAEADIKRLCSKINCIHRSACLTPKIEEVFLFSKVTPGGKVAIKGCGFGSGKGTFTLKYVDYEGVPKSRALTVLDWKNGLVGGTIPPDIVGAKDHLAKLQIKTQNNAFSNEWEVTFRAAKEIKLLTWSDVKVLQCGTDSNNDACNYWQDPDDDWWLPPIIAGSTISGFHSNCWACVGNDIGSDTYEIMLLHDWVFDSKSFAELLGNDSGDWLHEPSGFQVGGTYWNPSIEWSVSSDDDLSYGLDVTVVGPKGVPWK